MAIDLVEDFFNTTVATKWNSTGAGNFYITVLPDATNGYLVINRSSSTKREIVKYTGQGTDAGGNYITIAASGDRGQGGTTAQTHELNEAVQMNLTAEHWSDLNDAIDAIVAGGSVDASTSQKGITKMSVAPAVATSPIAVGDNDSRVPSADPDTLYEALGNGITSDEVTQSADLQTQTTSTNTIEVGEADATTKKNSLAQSFTSTKTKMRGFKLFKKADTGSFTGDMVITLMADSSGDPSGTALATSTITNAEWLLLTDAAEFEAVFATEYASVVVGDTYHIDIQPSTSDNSNHPNLGADTSGGAGTVKYNNTTDGWVAITLSYLYYKTMEGNESQVVKTTADGIIEGFQKLPVVQKYTSSSVWEKPAGLSHAIFEAQGTGGDGAGGSTDDCGSGGGSGGYAKIRVNTSDLSSTETITIGGGSSTVTVTGGSTLTANDGSNGAALSGSNTVVGGAGGTALNGDINIAGQKGGVATADTAIGLYWGGAGGDSILGLGGYGSISAGTDWATGGSATGYGGGGGGGSSSSGSNPGGAGTGATGVVIITEFF